MHTREHADADEADQEADEPPAVHALARLPANRQQHDEDRHRGIGDRGHSGVDVLLAPGDQRERNRAVDDPEREAFPAEPSHLGQRRPQPALRDEHEQERESRDQQAEHDHRRGLEGAIGDLDEHVGRAPERGQQGDVDPVGARHVLEATVPTSPSTLAARWAPCTTSPRARSTVSSPTRTTRSTGFSRFRTTPTIRTGSSGSPAWAASSWAPRLTSGCSSATAWQE